MRDLNPDRKHTTSLEEAYFLLWSAEQITRPRRIALRDRGTGKFSKLGFQWPSKFGCDPRVNAYVPIQNPDGSWELCDMDVKVIEGMTGEPTTTSRMVSDALSMDSGKFALSPLSRLQRYGLVDGIKAQNQARWFLTDVGLAERDRRRALRPNN